LPTSLPLAPISRILTNLVIAGSRIPRHNKSGRAHQYSTQVLHCRCPHGIGIGAAQASLHRNGHWSTLVTNPLFTKRSPNTRQTVLEPTRHDKSWIPMAHCGFQR
jgi:hypothetical protein